MSYTPDDQLLEDSLTKVADALEALSVPIRNRMKHPSEWKDSHLAELSELLKKVVDLEIDCRLMAGKVV